MGKPNFSLNFQELAMLDGAALRNNPPEQQASHLLAVFRKLAHLTPKQAAERCRMSEREYADCEQSRISVWQLAQLRDGLALKGKQVNYLVQTWLRNEQNPECVAQAMAVITASEEINGLSASSHLPINNACRVREGMEASAQHNGFSEKRLEAAEQRISRIMRDFRGTRTQAQVAELFEPADRITISLISSWEKGRIASKYVPIIINGYKLQGDDAENLVDACTELYSSRRDQTRAASDLQFINSMVVNGASRRVERGMDELQSLLDSENRQRR